MPSEPRAARSHERPSQVVGCSRPDADRAGRVDRGAAGAARYAAPTARWLTRLSSTRFLPMAGSIAGLVTWLGRSRIELAVGSWPLLADG